MPSRKVKEVPLENEDMFAPGTKAIRFLTEDECEDQDCASCLIQFLPMRYFVVPHLLDDKYVSDHEAQASARNFTDQATREWHYVRDRLCIYGDALRSRWRKLSTANRQALILQAQPDLYPHKSPEQRIMFEVEKPEKKSRFSRQQRNALLVPYLNMETLVSDPSRLLSLLHHRSAGSLQDWVSFDAEQMRIGFQRGFLAKKFNSKCVVLSGDDFGKLVEWDKDACHGWLMVGFPLANLILEAQSFLLSFLHKMVDLIVTPGKSHEGNLEWNKLISAGFKAVGEVECWSVHSNQPFSAPPAFNANRWLREATAQLVSAQDHLYLLQTDAVYLQYHLRLGSEKIHPDQNPDAFWLFKAGELVLWESIHGIRRLRQIVDQCEYLVTLEGLGFKSSSNIASSRYDMALSVLVFIAERDLSDCLGTMRRMFHSHGDFRRNFTYLCTSDGTVMGKLKWDVESIGGQKQLFENDPLLWALLALTDGIRDIAACNKSLAMRLIDDCLKDPEERRRISPPLYAFVSRIAMYDLMLSELNHLRPHVVPFDPEAMMDYNEETWLAIRYQTQGPRKPTPGELHQILPLLKKVCEKPWPKGNKDRKWLEEARQIRHDMQILWGTARSIFVGMCSSPKAWNSMSCGEILTELTSMAADLTDEYQEEVETEEDDVAEYLQAIHDAKVAKCAALKAAKDAVPQTVWGEDKKEEKFRLPGSRAKAKSRLERVSPQADEVDVQAARLAETLTLSEEDATPANTIEVNAESIRIFSRMFSTGEESKGIVKWQQVVTAMADAGFAATHCGGSAVSFCPVEGAPMKGSIVFHKPHPEPNVDSVMLHTIGKRLRKWFGWRSETFVDREKKKG